MTIAHCDKNIKGRLRSFGAGFADSSVKNEAELLLSRTGKKKSVMYLFIPNWVNNFSGGSSGGARGIRPPPPLFLDQTGRKKKIETGHPLYLGVWMTAPPSPAFLQKYIFVKKLLFYKIYFV